MALAILGSNLSSASATPSAGCFNSRFGGSIDCSGKYSVPGQVSLGGSADEKPSGSTPKGPPSPPPITPAQAYSIACVNDLAGAAAGLNAPICTPPSGPAAPPPPAGPAPPPVAYAVQFWRTIPLPVPRPDIPPGYAITGKTAYLVTNGTTSPPRYVDNTPLGQLTVQATGRYIVDWGDSNPVYWAGPYAMEGQPWPKGQITHTYEIAGTYTVTVEEEWTAVWHLAGATGTLGGLHTTATIQGFRVEQLQAVITN